MVTRNTCQNRQYLSIGQVIAKGINNMKMKKVLNMESLSRRKKRLDISEIITVRDINNLDIEVFKSDDMNTNGWTRISTDKSIIGYMDKLKVLCLLSTNENSKLLFRCHEAELYYAKTRVKRKICKKCRNEAYKGEKAGRWTDNDNCLVGAWFPNIINPIRPSYNDIATVYCPGPVVNKWINGYMIPKIYNILANPSKPLLCGEELEMLHRGYKYHCTLKKLQEVKSKNRGDYKKALNAKLDADIFDRIKINIDSPRYAGREVILPPPIWCPYREQHSK